MKTKLGLLLTTSALAIAGFIFLNATPAVAGSTLPGALEHSTRFCGCHHHHHGHYWSNGGCTFYCPGHCD
jgi:hypothetical protein